MPLVKVKAKGQVTIPAEFRDQLHLDEGDFLDAVVQNNEIILKPKAIVDRKLQSYIEEGVEEIRTGKTVGPFESMEEYEEYINPNS